MFEATYGPEGLWATLFRRHKRYLGTRLLRDVGVARVYVPMHTWESHEAYREVLEKYAAEYEKLDRECETMTVREGTLGELDS